MADQDDGPRHDFSVLETYVENGITVYKCPTVLAYGAETQSHFRRPITLTRGAAE